MTVHLAIMGSLLFGAAAPALAAAKSPEQPVLLSRISCKKKAKRVCREWDGRAKKRCIRWEMEECRDHC